MLQIYQIITKQYNMMDKSIKIIKGGIHNGKTEI
jgi:hypothetical protein